MNIIQETRDPFSFSACPSEEDANVNGFVHGGIIFYLPSLLPTKRF